MTEFYQSNVRESDYANFLVYKNLPCLILHALSVLS